LAFSLLFTTQAGGVCAKASEANTKKKRIP
jgi:hypothetical protein